MGYKDGNRLFIDAQIVSDLAGGTLFSPTSALYFLIFWHKVLQVYLVLSLP